MVPLAGDTGVTERVTVAPGIGFPRKSLRLA